MQTYIVGHGDSVSKISKILYGDFSKTQEICKMNNLVDCNLVQPGQVLKVPDPTNLKDAEVVPLTAATGGWKKTVGKWFPWIVVGVTAYLLTKQAHKAHKKRKAAKSKPLGSHDGKKSTTPTVTAKFIYEDDWSQKVYKGSDGKKYVEVDGVMHTMTSEGEANYPVRHVKKIDGLSGKKLGPRKTKKKFHGKKAVKIGDWKVRYNSLYKKYQATHEGGNVEEFDTIKAAKKYIKRHG